MPPGARPSRRRVFERRVCTSGARGTTSAHQSGDRGAEDTIFAFVIAAKLLEVAVCLLSPPSAGIDKRRFLRELIIWKVAFVQGYFGAVLCAKSLVRWSFSLTAGGSLEVAEGSVFCLCGSIPVRE